MIQYFKNHQYDDIWQYYKVFTDRDPPCCEIMNFLNEEPRIEIREYDLKDFESRKEYHSFWEYGDHSTADEYGAAYKRATANAFTLLVNGKLM